MSTTHIQTRSMPRVDLGLQGEVADILNRELCGAENVVGRLRWLERGERFIAEALDVTHQLLYLMEGEGVIGLDGQDYPVRKGAGLYLGPAEAASLRHAGAGTLKLFHLIVPQKDDG